MALRKSTNPKVGILREVSLFSACNDKELAKIASLTDELKVAEGRVLTAEGRTGNECFIIVDGEAEATLRGEHLAVLGPGAVIGEMALLDGGPRSATVTATTPMRVLVLDPRSFSGLLTEYAQVTRKVMRSLAQRLRTVEGAPTA